MSEALKPCPSGCKAAPRRIGWAVIATKPGGEILEGVGCDECELQAPIEVWQALPRANDCAELVEAFEGLYKAAKRTSGIGAYPGHHFVLLLAAVLEAKSALAKHKEPAQ